MLTALQLEKLQEEDQKIYLEYVEQGDTESISQFEYFYGFTIQTDKVVIPTNKELQLYRDFTDTVKLKHIAQMLEFVPHPGQQPVFYTLDEKKDIINNIVMVLGRRAQPLDSIIKSPTGDITFRDVKEGDIIFDPNGGTQVVTEVHPIKFSDEVYEVRVGDVWCTVDADHMFTVYSTLGEEVTLDARTLKDTYLGFSKYVPFNYRIKSPVQLISTNTFEYIKEIRKTSPREVRCISVSAEHECYITDNFIRTHNCGKSISTSVIAVRELAVPYSSTILLTPTFNNAKIIFNEVLKNIQKIKLPIKSINRGSFRFELENGARFSANSAANVESALGSYNSLIIVDETQSVPDILEIMNQMLVPTLLDYGVRPSGILYGKQIYLGTPRGQENQLYDLYCNQDTFPNWKSFNAPSTSNPTLPTSYFSQMRLELGEMIYRQEILAEFFGADDNVFWAFNKELNTYQPGAIAFNSYMAVVSGIDIGFRDSTAQLWAYRDSAGNYYIDKAYQENMKSTQTHVSNYREIEDSMLSKPEMRYIDPAAAQTAFDLQSTYDYDCVGANNSIDASIAYINVLLTPTGANNRPRLFINAELTELIRQISRVRWKDSVSKTSKDPFNKDPKGTHWDLIAALRYMLYSDSFNMDGAFVAMSSSAQ